MILVTGATGFLGLHLLIELTNSNDKPIKAIFRSEKKLAITKNHFLRINPYTDPIEKWDQINWIKADITDTPSLENAFENCTVVYHCAALVSLINKDFPELKKINIQGTANMVNFSILNNIEKFCLVSSIATLNLNPGESVYSENSQWNNEALNSGYAISKHGAEMEVWRGIQEGLNAVIVNPGVILGKGFYKEGSSSIFTKTKQGIPFYTNGGTGFVGASDCAKIMLKLMEQNEFSQRFILVSENITYKKVMHTIAGQLNSKKPSKAISKTFLSLIANIEHFLNLTFNRQPTIPLDIVNSLTTVSNYSNEKTTSTLNYNFTIMDSVIKSTCEDFIQVYQQ